MCHEIISDISRPLAPTGPSLILEDRPKNPPISRINQNETSVENNLKAGYEQNYSCESVTRIVLKMCKYFIGSPPNCHPASPATPTNPHPSLGRVHALIGSTPECCHQNSSQCKDCVKGLKLNRK